MKSWPSSETAGAPFLTSNPKSIPGNCRQTNLGDALHNGRTIDTLPKCQGHEREREIKEQFQMKGDKIDMKSMCYV